MKRGAPIGGLLPGAKVCLGPRGAKVKDKEGASAYGGKMALLTPGFQASGTVREFISSVLSHPVYGNVSGHPRELIRLSLMHDFPVFPLKLAHKRS